MSRPRYPSNFGNTLGQITKGRHLATAKSDPIVLGRFFSLYLKNGELNVTDSEISCQVNNTVLNDPTFKYKASLIYYASAVALLDILSKDKTAILNNPERVKYNTNSSLNLDSGVLTLNRKNRLGLPESYELFKTMVISMININIENIKSHMTWFKASDKLEAVKVLNKLKLTKEEIENNELSLEDLYSFVESTNKRIRQKNDEKKIREEENKLLKAKMEAKENNRKKAKKLPKPEDSTLTNK